MLLESQIPTRGFMGGQFGLLRDFQKQYEKRGALVPPGCAQGMVIEQMAEVSPCVQPSGRGNRAVRTRNPSAELKNLLS